MVTFFKITFLIIEKFVMNYGCGATRVYTGTEDLERPGHRGQKLKNDEYAA